MTWDAIGWYAARFSPYQWDGTLISSSHHGGFSPGFFVGKPDWLKTEAFLRECVEMHIPFTHQISLDILRLLIAKSPGLQHAVLLYLGLRRSILWQLTFGMLTFGIPIVLFPSQQGDFWRFVRATGVKFQRQRLKGDHETCENQTLTCWNLRATLWLWLT